MAGFTIPDKGEGDSDIQSIFFQEALEVIVDGINGPNCVLSGLAVTGGASMTPAVAKGAVLTNGVLKAVAAANVTITTADATNPRLDLIVVDSSGALQVRAGTAAANPKPPSRTANDVVIAQVYIPAGDTTIATTQITDRRMLRTGGPICIHKTTTATTFNTTGAQQTYYTLTLPSGLLLAGRVLHVSLGGTMLLNSGTPTFDVAIDYGGTTMFADTGQAGTADADRRAWYLDMYLVAVANNSQVLNGLLSFNTLAAAVTAPTTGVSGNITAAENRLCILNGTAAVDSDAADRTLNVKWTMNTSNINNEISCQYARADLL